MRRRLNCAAVDLELLELGHRWRNPAAGGLPAPERTGLVIPSGATPWALPAHQLGRIRPRPTHYTLEGPSTQAADCTPTSRRKPEGFRRSVSILIVLICSARVFRVRPGGADAPATARCGFISLQRQPVWSRGVARGIRQLMRSGTTFPKRLYLFAPLVAGPGWRKVRETFTHSLGAQRATPPSTWSPANCPFTATPWPSLQPGDGWDEPVVYGLE